MHELSALIGDRVGLLSRVPISDRCVDVCKEHRLVRSHLCTEILQSFMNEVKRTF